MPQGIIFDIDGTLIDSVDAHATAWQQAFAHFGHHLGFLEIRRQIGKGADQLMPVFLPPALLDEQGEAIDQMQGDIFRRDFLPRLRAFPGTRPLFLHLAARDQRIALASSAKGEELAIYQRLADIADLVDVATSADDAERSKPYPDIFAAALQRLGLAAVDVVVIGDSPYDAQAAAQLGITTIGLLCGGFAEAALRQAGCAALYANPLDLLRRYDGSLLDDQER